MTAPAARGAVTGRPLLRVEALSKTFGGTRVLDDVSFEVAAGEVHGLLGENGSGKSTLLKVLTGVHAPDAGTRLHVRGEPVPLPMAPGAFRSLGISVVHQDLALLPDLSVAENVRVAQAIAGPRALVSWRQERRVVAEQLARFGIDLDPAAPVSSLGETDRALVAIVRAVGELGARRSLLILDEPTVFLPREGTQLLFRVVADLVADGRTSVLLVSHDLTEVLAHTDRVTVLRDGRVRATLASAATSTGALTELITGRTASAVRLRRPDAPTARGSVVAQVEHLRGPGVDDVSFTVAAGEVLGLTGLAGSGYERVLPQLYGAEPAGGALTLTGLVHDLARARPATSLRDGVVYIPADRRHDGGIVDLSVADNVTMPVLTGPGRRWTLRPRALAARARQLADDYDVRPRDPGAVFGALSGGNQQKAVLAKWLQTAPRLVLLSEPTQGVDVGARARIVELLRAAMASGGAAVCASSDYEQLASLCDRVLVMARGRVVAELSGPELSAGTLSEHVLSSTSVGRRRLQEAAA